MDATEQEIRRSASDARVLLPYIATFVELLARLSGRKDVLPLTRTGPLSIELSIGEWSAISIWARRRGLQLERGIEQAAEFGPAITAMLQLLRMFSFARGPIFEGDYEEKLARLKPHEQNSIVQRVRTFAEENPDLVETIRSASEASGAPVEQSETTSSRTRPARTRPEPQP
jgi:hypothetical protein